MAGMTLLILSRLDCPSSAISVKIVPPLEQDDSLCDRSDSMLRGERKKLSGWPTWVLLPSFPLADNASRNIEMCGEYRLTDGCLGSNLSNRLGRQCDDRSQTFLAKLPHRSIVDHPCLMKPLSCFMNCRKGRAAVGSRSGLSSLDSACDSFCRSLLFHLIGHVCTPLLQWLLSCFTLRICLCGSWAGGALISSISPIFTSFSISSSERSK